MKFLTVLLIAWYFAVGKDVFGPFDSRTRCERARVPMTECYCVLMFPTDCQDLVA